MHRLVIGRKNPFSWMRTSLSAHADDAHRSVCIKLVGKFLRELSEINKKKGEMQEPHTYIVPQNTLYCQYASQYFTIPSYFWCGDLSRTVPYFHADTGTVEDVCPYVDFAAVSTYTDNIAHSRSIRTLTFLPLCGTIEPSKTVLWKRGTNDDDGRLYAVSAEVRCGSRKR